jgi:glycine/D-amino acid oxidase-like deaminating enzyme/nitrite reductase/ring-hydroxylating ferredoxin subunit
MTGVRDSLWMQTSTGPQRPKLEGQRRYDAAVIGAGITGATSALLLKRAGLRVALVEMGTVCQGVTGYTTAKVSSLHELIYADLTANVGEDAARVYGQANEAALAQMAALVAELDIDCAWERRPNYTYTLDPDLSSKIEQEAQVARELGLPATYTTDTDLPFPVLAAVRFDDQAQFHPRDYVLALADQVQGDGSDVYEHSRVVDVRDGQPATVRTESGSIEADVVVVATHLPILDRGAFFSKAHPSRSYAVAVEAGSYVPAAMYINTESPTRSVRAYQRGGETLLVLSGGEAHKPGAEPDEQEQWDALVRWGQEELGAGAVRYLWSAHDYKPVDGMPYIGKVARSSRSLYTATGFRKWGMTGGTLSAMILADIVRGLEHPWAAVFDANRITPKASAKSFVQENLEVAKHFLTDRLGDPGPEALDGLEAGDGTVIRVDGEAYAVCRDAAGDLCSVSPVCTHMGCHVLWNRAERSWDCPCHGSRFAAEGTVIQGPAVRDLDAKPLPDGIG